MIRYPTLFHTSRREVATILYTYHPTTPPPPTPSPRLAVTRQPSRNRATAMFTNQWSSLEKTKPLIHSGHQDIAKSIPSFRSKQQGLFLTKNGRLNIVFQCENTFGGKVSKQGKFCFLYTVTMR